MLRHLALVTIVSFVSWSLGSPCRADEPPAPPPAPAAPSTPTPPDLPPPSAPPLPAAPVADAVLAAIRAETDPAKQRAAIAALHAQDAAAFLSLVPGTLAALAPDVLHVYDLAGALAEGGDDPMPPTLDMLGEAAAATDPSPPSTTTALALDTSAASRRAHRIADTVRDALGAAAGDGAPTLVAARTPATAPYGLDAGPACLVVLAEATGFARVEAALDRVASIGGPTRLVSVDILASTALARALDLAPAALAQALDARPASIPKPLAAPPPSEADRAAARVARFVLPATRERRASAWRLIDLAYVSDVDVEISQGASTFTPLVRSASMGLSASALAEQDPAGGGDRVRLDLAWSDLVRPMGTFTTTLGQGAPQVQIELPELRVARSSSTLAVGDAPSRWTLVLPPATASGPATFALLEIDAPSRVGTAAGRGWTRVAAQAAAPTPPGAVVTVTVSVRADDAKEGASHATISAHEGQTGTLQVITRTARVAGLRVAPGTTIVDPEVGTIAEGSTTEVTARAAVDGKRAFDVIVSTHRVDRPLRTFRWNLTATTPAEVTLPVTRTVVRPYRAVLAPGTSASFPAVLAREGGASVPATVTITYVGDAPPAADAATPSDAGGAAVAVTPPARAGGPPPEPPPHHVSLGGAPADAPPAPTAPPVTEAHLASIRAATDAATRATAIEAVRAASPAGFLALSVGELATLAPDVLRVYDLAGALTEGGDDAPPEGLDVPDDAVAPADEVPSAAVRRARRVARAVERVLADPRPGRGPTFALVRPGGQATYDARMVHTTLVVLAPPADVAEVERVLDRHASIGGPAARVTVDVLRDDALFARLAPGGSGRTLAAAERPPDATIDVARVVRFALDVPYAREVGAWRAVRAAHLRPVGGALGDATPPTADAGIVGHSRDAVAVRAIVEPGPSEAAAQLRVTLSTLFGVVPTLGAAIPAGRCQLPEARVQETSVAWLLGDGAFDAVEPLDDHRVVALVHVERADGPRAPLARGWARVEPGTASLVPAEREEIVTVAVDFIVDETGERHGMARMGALAGQEAVAEGVHKRTILADVTLGERGVVRQMHTASVVEGLSLTVIPRPKVGGHRVFDGVLRTRWLDLPIAQGSRPLTDGARVTVHLPVERDVARPFRVELTPGAEARLPVRTVASDGTVHAFTVLVGYVGDDGAPAPAPVVVPVPPPAK